MSPLRFSVSVCWSLCALWLAGCGSDSSPASEAAGASSAGTAGESAAGASSEGGSAGDGSEAGTSAGGSSAGANSAGSSAAGSGAAGAASTSPCSYTVSGGQTFPTGTPDYLCLNNSRLMQPNGKGDYDILFTSAFQDEDMSSSNFACSISSATPPAAGDTWVLGPDHAGVCNLSKSVGLTATLWKAGGKPVKGSFSLKFLSASLQHGASEPDDVYYLFDVEFEGLLPAGDTPDAPDVTVQGHYRAKALPPGN